MNNKIIDEKNKPSCKDCEYGHFYSSGDGWNEPYEIDFECDMMGEMDDAELEYLDVDDVSGCTFFKPIMVEKCGHCNKPMNIPLYQARHVCNIFGEHAYCSRECHEKSEEEFMKI